jgi:hypothetical protein
MQRSRQRKLLLTAVAVASGVTICCSCGGIGLYNPGWDAAFEDAAKDASHNDVASDAEVEAGDDAGDATDATSD